MQKLLIQIILLNILSINMLLGQDVRLQKKIALPTETLHDTLDNGLQYFIKNNNNPKERIEIRLCFNVGSIQENKHQKGVAHFLEHMAFEGSKNYPNDQAIKFWESIGAKFGIDINAYTGYDRTVYTLSINNDPNTQNLEQTLLFLKDWITNLTLSQKSIEKQKKIVYEEIASTPISNKLERLKKGNNTKLKNLPIGRINDVKNISQNTLIHFYKRWYTTKNTAIIIVGNIDLMTTKNRIVRIFNDIATKQHDDMENYHKIVYNKNTMFYPIKNEAKSEVKLSIICPYTYQNTLILNDLFEEQKNKFALQIINKYLRNNALQVYRYWYLVKTGFLEFTLSEKQNIKQKLTESLSILEGLKTRGVKEFDINNLLPKYIDKLSNTDFIRSSYNWANTFVEMYILKERQLSTSSDREIIIKNLKKLDTACWNKTIRNMLTLKKQKLICYEFNPIKHPKLKHKDLKYCFNLAKLNPKIPSIKPTLEKKAIKLPNFLVQNTTFQKNTIIQEQFFSNIGLDVITLKNGAKLYLKPTKGDKRINLNLIFKGGLSLLPKNKFRQMEDLIPYISLGGSQHLNNNDFGDVLLQENITLANTNEDYFHGIMASALTSKTKILCNLLVDKILNPELCYKDFKVIKQDEIDNFNEKNTPLTPQQKLNYKIEALKGSLLHQTKEHKKLEDIEQCDLDSLYHYYKKHFTNPKNMVCIATGHFEIDSVKQYLIGMLNKLPQNTEENKKIIKTNNLTKPIEEKIATDNHRLDLTIIYYGNYKNNLRNQLILKLMKDILRKRLLLELRERNGYVYSPYINLTFKTQPYSKFFFTISGTTDNKNCQPIKNTTKLIIKRLQENAISSEELTELKKSFLLAKKSYLDNNLSNNWQDYLQTSYKTDISPIELNSYNKILNSITIDDILTAFKTMINKQQISYLFLGDCL